MNLNRPTVSMDAIIAGSRMDTSNPQMQQMLERLANHGDGSQADSLDKLVKQRGLQDGLASSNLQFTSLEFQMMNHLQGFNNGSQIQDMNNSQMSGFRQAGEASIGGDQGGWTDLAAKAAIKVAHEKVNRLIKEARQAVDDVKLSIQMSHDRMQDRSMEESKLKKVSQTEVEVAQAMALLPYSKDLYEYKTKQLNDVSSSDT